MRPRTGLHKRGFALITRDRPIEKEMYLLAIFTSVNRIAKSVLGMHTHVTNQITTRGPRISFISSPHSSLSLTRWMDANALGPP